MINVDFNYLKRHHLGQLKDGFSLNDLLQLVSLYFKNPSDYRFIISGKELDLFNTQSFIRCQSLFGNSISILVLRRIRGGGFVEIQILTNIILYDLEKALEQIPTRNNEERPCQTFRGMNMTNNDLAQYTVGTRLMTKSFLSTTKNRSVAEAFAICRSATTDNNIPTLCTYTIKNRRTAYDLETISEYPEEKEVLIIPYSAFIVKGMDRYESPSETGIVIKIELEECEAVSD
ncbi:unnamed protein product [Adineta steineri]|uniref:ADP ribosyltransferase domain-containing protein n=1 Tax=Adineta steineri TaxID=433720 RepID=A0A818RLN3_9BILA|nr:unnamed protein product [Adineta steineri]CAF0940125.1 unnamed protein product [Adineta steineri]CAF3659456.1 unnamed protein product [Adineta steineri]CAF3976850.1 unnamed protein product [Adineta steineri]